MTQFKRRPIDLYEHMNTIMKELKKGVTITTQADGKANSMTISWGSVGIEWMRPIFVTYVRTGRYTHELLEKNGEFTVNIALPGSKVNKIKGYVGTKSGRDEDKLAALGLNLVDGEQVNVPAIAELPMTLECKVVYKQDQDLSKMPAEFVEKFYPQDVDSSYHSANKDTHTMYFGEIVNAYILEEVVD